MAVQLPGANPIKTSWSLFIHSFYKLDRSSGTGKMVFNNETAQLTKRVGMFTQKRFIGLAPLGILRLLKERRRLG
jgi:hypothetical protein